MCLNSEQSGQHARAIQGTRDAFDAFQNTIFSLMESHRYSRHELFSVRVAIEEALANAVLHGHQGNESLEIDVTWRVDESFVEVSVADKGRGFDPSTVPDPTASENLMLPSGRGIAMMRAFMDEIHVNDKGNHVTMMYRKKDC